MSTINIGVIGLGRMGQIYSKHAANRVESARLVAVSDISAAVVTALTEGMDGVTGYADYENLLADPRVDAVIITTPTSTHAQIVMAAAAAGKAIFCEKPTALTLAATDQMIAAVDKAGVPFQIGFMRRFDRGYRAAKAKIEAGAIGTPVTIHSISRDPYRTSLDYANPAKSGGILIDMGIHDMDVCRWLMGDEITQVYAQAEALVYPELADVGDVDNAMALANFSRGGLGFVEASRNARYGYDIQCEIIGTQGALRVGYLQETPLLVLTSAGVTHDVVPYFLERFGPAYTAQIDDFVDCIVHDRAPVCGPVDARAALHAAIAATQSQHAGRPVRLDEVT